MKSKRFPSNQSQSLSVLHRTSADPHSHNHYLPVVNAQLGKRTIPEFHDLVSSLTFITEPTGTVKTTALRKAGLLWSRRTVWSVARNRMTAIQTGLLVASKPFNCLTMALLRRRISMAMGPVAGDVLVVDEFLLLDHMDVELIEELSKSGVIVKAIIDVKGRR